MSETEIREGFFLRQSRVVESFAARAKKRGGDEGNELPDWAPEAGEMTFEFSFAEEANHAGHAPASVTFAICHTRRAWALRVTIAVVIGGPASALERLRIEPREHLTELGELYWPEIRAAVKSAANAIEAQVKIPPVHPARWTELDDKDSPPADVPMT